MGRPTWRARWQYWFDNWMSRGTIAIMSLLAVATAIFVFAIAVLVSVLRAFPADAADMDFWDVVWGNLMRTLDPGTMGADSGWGFRLLMLLVTVGGLIIVASLIGIVSGAFDEKMAQLRKGRSRVLEADHTLLLGWSSKLIPIIAELCIANDSRRRSAIVVLANRDKVEMEELIHAGVPRPGRTRIICRSGDPTSPRDLRLVSPRAARSVIILPADTVADADVGVIKTALALTRELEGASPQVVAELRDRTNLDAAELAGGGRIQWLLAHDAVCRMMVQTTRLSGLSAVYTELLDFAGDEIYFTAQPQLGGQSYLDAQLRFDTATVIGLARRSQIVLNPPADHALHAQDQLIVLAADDTAITPAPPASVDAEAIRLPDPAPARPERTLILGCNSSLQLILDELSAYVAPGSMVHVAADVDAPNIDVPTGLSVEFTRVDSTNRKVLDALDVASYDHVLVLAYREALELQAADARTLVTLLHVRDIADRQAVNLNVVSEMLDDKNRALAELTRADDFIVSDHLVSLMLSQISENSGLLAVFTELFSSTGVEIYLRAAELYVDLDVPVEFGTVAVAAARRRETAIGYRRCGTGDASGTASEVRLNPRKSDRRCFRAGDAIIVLADHTAEFGDDRCAMRNVGRDSFPLV